MTFVNDSVYNFVILFLLCEGKMAVKKEDIRITRTKAALTNAFFEMLAELTLENITVNDLCARADVRRATFYKHFKDKDDFVVFLIKDVRERFDNETWKKDAKTAATKEYYLKYAEAVIDYLIKREVAIKNMINSPMQATFIQTFVQLNYEETARRLEESKEAGMTLMASTDIVASMLIGGISHCIVCWFGSDDRCSSEELLDSISKFITMLIK